MSESTVPQINQDRLLQLSMGIVATFIIGVVLLELRSVLLPLVLAFFLATIFKPMYLGLLKKKVPSVIALLLVLISVGLILFLVGFVVYSSAQSLAEVLPQYEAKFRSMLGGFALNIESWSSKIGVDMSWSTVLDSINWNSITGAVTTGLGSFISILTNLFLVLIFMLFILAGSGGMTEKIYQAFSDDNSRQIGKVLGDIDSRIKKYLTTKTLISLGTSGAVTVVLWILGVDFFLLWGFLSFLLNFIPNVGSILATILPFLVSLLQFESLAMPIMVLVLVGGIQLVMGNVIEPRMLASELNLSPVLVLFGLILWGWLWGIWGAVLAIPIISTIKIVFEHIEPLKPIAVLMSAKASNKLDLS